MSEARVAQGELFAGGARPARESTPLHAELRRFDRFGSRSLATRSMLGGRSVPTYANEFWTSKQRDACSLHEVSYRACFKPQLPRFFLDRLSAPGDVVHDPFAGRGTTLVEAALAGRVPLGCDINPLSRVLILPRLAPPSVEAVAARLAAIDFAFRGELPDDLLVFFHEGTLREICALRQHLARPDLDDVDAWIQMVAVNRLTGHSKGFFSVYTMPPNQAVTLESQRKINAKRRQVPERRDVPALILRKTRSLLADVDDEVRARLAAVREQARVLTCPAERSPAIAAGSVQLVVTSPPFLDVVQYKDDNWLRCWFCGIDAGAVPIAMHRKLADWQTTMTAVFRELRRVLRQGGAVAFEVGEVRGGKVRLEEAVVPCALAAGLEPELLLIQEQEFTKTANCWGVANNRKGTNTNRVVVLRKG